VLKHPCISLGCVAKSKKSCQEIKIALIESFVEINAIEKKHRSLIFDKLVKSPI
jgi:hypothetical protein